LGEVKMVAEKAKNYTRPLRSSPSLSPFTLVRACVRTWYVLHHDGEVLLRGGVWVSLRTVGVGLDQVLQTTHLAGDERVRIQRTGQDRTREGEVGRVGLGGVGGEGIR
jgi:hypothetical protein